MPSTGGKGGKVVSIGSRGVSRARGVEDQNTGPRLWPRVVSHAPGLPREAIFAGCAEQERLILKYEPRLTALVARILVDGAHEKGIAPADPRLRDWVGAVLASPGDDDDEHDDDDASSEPASEAPTPTPTPAADVVEVTSRDQAIEITEPWSSICVALAEPPPADRLDVVVETHSTIGLLSFDPEPALPVTRKQAEAANLPPHLLFARGAAFASLAQEAADIPSLTEAFVAHRRLVDEQSDEVLEHLMRATLRTPLEELAGVLLALGPEGHAVSAVTREQARKLVAGKPFLERKLDRGAMAGATDDGRDILSVPIVVWAKGHVSIQTRELVESK